MSAKLKLEGFEEVSKMFNNLERNIQKKVMRPSLRAGAKVAKAYIESNAPHPDLSKTKIKSRSWRGYLKVTVNWPTRQELGIAADADFYWPAIFEYGAPPHIEPNHPIFSKISHPGVVARPVLRPAIDTQRDKIVNAVGRELGKRILQVAKQ